MRRSHIGFLAVVLSASAATSPECSPVTGERILAKDLAAVVPIFAALSPEEPIGFAPLPGARRVFRGEDLARLAARHRLNHGSMEAVCFVVPAETLKPETLETAIRTELKLPAESLVELVDYSKQPVPPGKLEFAHGFSTSTKDVSMLRGKLVYGERRSVPVWVLARVRVKRSLVIAGETLRAGEPISESHLRVELTDGPPADKAWIANVQDAVGRTPRRPIPAGSPILASMLKQSTDIERGDVVNVVVTSGAAKISVPAKAIAGGRRGDQIVLTNSESGRKFSARIEGKGKASVVVLPRASETDPPVRSGGK
jgi:flagella basal body P-ring formation protein FlgA